MEPVENEEVMKDSMMVGALLKRARQHLQRGWCQNALAETASGRRTTHFDGQAARFCAVGAIRLAMIEMRLAVGVDWEHEASLRVAAAVPLADRESIGLWANSLVVMWNNAPGRSQEEVLRAFDEAAGGK